MKSITSTTCALLSACFVGAFALPAWAIGPAVQIIEHESCHEIQMPPMSKSPYVDATGFLWSIQDYGLMMLDDPRFDDLKQNKLLNLRTYWEENNYNLNLVGKSVVPDVWKGDEELYFWNYDLWEEPADMFGWSPGKVVTFMEPKDERTLDGRDPIALGIILFRNDSLKPLGDCQYVDGAIDIRELQDKSTRCIWFDAATRGPNDKPYCMMHRE